MTSRCVIVALCETKDLILHTYPIFALVNDNKGVSNEKCCFKLFQSRPNPKLRFPRKVLLDQIFVTGLLAELGEFDLIFQATIVFKSHL